jgi:hypothetical protein
MIQGSCDGVMKMSARNKETSLSYVDQESGKNLQEIESGMHRMVAFLAWGSSLVLETRTVSPPRVCGHSEYRFQSGANLARRSHRGSLGSNLPLVSRQ